MTSSRVLGKVGLVLMAQKVTANDISVYRMKHLPTGLYYIPSRKVKVTSVSDWSFVKSNLSKRGKVYAKKPSLKFLGDRYYSHINLTWVPENNYPENIYRGNRALDRLFPVVPSEWAIEKV